MPAPRSADEPKMLLEVLGGIGTTAVDINQWAGTTANDWSTFSYAITGRLFFARLGSARVGAEAGFQHLLWYNTMPFGASSPYRYDSEPSHVAGVVRFALGRSLTLDAGAGAHFFGGVTKVGALAALGYHVRLGPKLMLPIQVRSDYLLTDPSALPVALHAGLGFRF